MVAKKPRIVIIGAGMAGLSTAYHIYRSEAAAQMLHVTLLEASHRIGGRIYTTEIGGDQVELGATWIHGIEGSPVYEIAQKIGALNTTRGPWERQDGFPCQAITKAEGGLTVDASLVEPPMDLYHKLSQNARHGKNTGGGDHGSMGGYARDGLAKFLLEQAPSDKEIEHGWSQKSLQEAAFSTAEYMERVMTAADSLHELDLAAEKEYEEYPGEHITIAKGYASILDELARVVPPSSFRFGSKVLKIVWNNSSDNMPPVKIECDNGSVVEADHVIVTVSLGVLKVAVGCPASGSPGAKNQLQFEPALPFAKVEAISRLGFGVVDKLFLHLDPAADEEQLKGHLQLLYKKTKMASNNGVPWWMRKTYSICPVYKESRVLLCWFAGKEAKEMESLLEEEVVEGVSNTLAEFGLLSKREEQCKNASSVSSSSWGDVSGSSSDSENSDAQCTTAEGTDKRGRSPLFRETLRSQWALNPLFLGSYSYVSTGSSGLDIDTLAEPLPKCSQITESQSPSLQLLFAGEATERHFYSTTHGAFLSGWREANRLLNHYSLPCHVTLV